MADDLTRARQQMLMARPWDAASEDELWEIAGVYPEGGGFTGCLATTVPTFVSGSDKVLFAFISPALATGRLIDPSWITRATPLLLVHRDEPGTAYYREDQSWIDSTRETRNG